MTARPRVRVRSGRALLDRAIIAAAGLLTGCAIGLADPVGEEMLSDIYESCVTSVVGSSPEVSTAMRMGYCYCVRDEVQRQFTAEALAAVRERVAANRLRVEDHERRERVFEACRGHLDRPR